MDEIFTFSTIKIKFVKEHTPELDWAGKSSPKCLESFRVITTNVGKDTTRDETESGKPMQYGTSESSSYPNCWV